LENPQDSVKPIRFIKILLLLKTINFTGVMKITYCSSLTAERIRQCAKEEFLAKGYQKANLRDIAKKARVTTGALYRHFKNKEDLFYVVVKEVYENTILLLKSTDETTDIRERMKENTFEKGLKRMRPFLDFIYRNMDEFKLLLLQAEGSGKEDFMERLVDVYTECNMDFIMRAYEAKIAKIMPGKLSVHCLTNGFLTAVFEVVIHDISREDSEKYFEDIGSFQFYGWNGLLGIEI